MREWNGVHFQMCFAAAFGGHSTSLNTFLSAAFTSTPGLARSLAAGPRAGARAPFPSPSPVNGSVMAQLTVMASGPPLLIAMAGPAIEVPRPSARTAFSFSSCCSYTPLFSPFEDALGKTLRTSQKLRPYGTVQCGRRIFPVQRWRPWPSSVAAIRPSISGRLASGQRFHLKLALRCILEFGQRSGFSFRIQRPWRFRR